MLRPTAASSARSGTARGNRRPCRRCSGRGRRRGRACGPERRGRAGGLAVTQGVEGNLHALKQFLDDHAGAGGAEGALTSTSSMAWSAWAMSRQIRTPLPRARPSALTAQRPPSEAAKREAAGASAKRGAGGRDAVFGHELLGEDLRGLHSFCQSSTRRLSGPTTVRSGRVAGAQGGGSEDAKTFCAISCGIRVNETAVNNYINVTKNASKVALVGWSMALLY